MPAPEPPSSSGSTPDDWFDVYRREATDRSEGELRQAFVRILAGEIERPGTFSVRTLRVLGMLDRGNCVAFPQSGFREHKVGDPIHGWATEWLSPRCQDSAVGGSLDQNCLAEHGFDYRR